MAKKAVRSSGNVFLDLGFEPHEASVMLLRGQLAEALRGWMERESLPRRRWTWGCAWRPDDGVA